MPQDNSIAHAISAMLSCLPDREALHAIVTAMSVQICLIELKAGKSRIEMTDEILALVRKMVIELEAMPDGQA